MERLELYTSRSISPCYELPELKISYEKHVKKIGEECVKSLSISSHG